MCFYFSPIMILVYFFIVFVVVHLIRLAIQAKKLEKLHGKKEITNEDLLNTIYFLFVIVMIAIALK